MTQSIGEKLRLERETRGIALREISEQTRISMRYLEAIETDDYQRLPGGIFNRSFIRAYAKYIGYDEHSAMEDYARTLRERGESDEESSTKPRSSVYTDDAAVPHRSPLRTLILAILILAALSLAVWAGLHFYKKSQGSGMTMPSAGDQSRTVRASGDGGAAAGLAKEVAHAFIA
jgi:cytoskeletal protein RodZ